MVCSNVVGDVQFDIGGSGLACVGDGRERQVMDDCGRFGNLMSTRANEVYVATLKQFFIYGDLLFSGRMWM